MKVGWFNEIMVWKIDLVVVEDFVQRPSGNPNFKTSMTGAMDCAKVTGYVLGLLNPLRKRTIIIPASIWKKQVKSKRDTPGRNAHERDASKLALWAFELVKRVQRCE